MGLALLIIMSIVAIGLFFWQLSNIISVVFGSPFVKTGSNVVEKAIKTAKIKKSDIFYELGCGNGEVLICASRYAKRAVGFEISPFYFLLSKLKTFRYTNIEVRYQNIRDVDLKKADIVYCYLLPSLLSKIDFSKIKKQAKIISVGFPITKLKMIERQRYNNHDIYIYSLSSR